MDEREAIARLQQGDISGLEALVSAYQTRAVRAADLIVRNRAAAEDIVQSAFVRAAERIWQFDPTRPFGPWFLRSVVNDALRLASRGQREVSLDSGDADDVSLAELLPDPAADPAQLAEDAEVQRTVWNALGRLSPRRRTVIVMRYYLGLSEEEMARELACSPGTVKSRLHAARQVLRPLLQSLLSLKGAEEGQPSSPRPALQQGQEASQ